MPELSAPLTQRLVEVLDCTLTLHRRVGDRSTRVSVTVTCGWNPDDVEGAYRDLLACRVRSEPDEEDWLTAQVAALHGYLESSTPRTRLCGSCSARTCSPA